MTTIFHDLLHDIMKDYANDLLGKSKTRGHIVVLTKIFKRLEKYKLRLNPKKCVFGVTLGKLLGFIISGKDMEVDPAKFKAIMEMRPPKTLKQLCSSQGKLQPIQQFIAQVADKCHPFSHLL